MVDVKTQLGEYKDRLDALQKQCTQAEKDAIIAETNYQNFLTQKEQLINELETFAGTSFDQVPEMLKNEQDTLQEIMNRLSAIDINGPITPEMVKELDSIMADFNIQPAE